MKWEMVKLGAVALNLDSKRKPLNEQERRKISSRGLYPYIGANNIMGYVDEFLFEEEIICVAEDGGSWGANEKCANYYHEKCWVNNHAHVLGFNGKANLKFLMYYLNFADLYKVITGTTRGKLTKSALESIPIPLPPLATQRRIAEILDKADALRQKDQALLRKYDELAQAVFVDMFGSNVNTVKLREITTKITDGVHAKPDYIDFGVPFLSVKNATNLYLDFSNVKYISQEDHNSFKKRCFPEYHDIIYTKVGATYGRSAIVETKEEFSIYVSLALIKPDREKIYPYYLNFVLNTHFVKQQADRRVKGAGVPDLHLIEIKDFDIPLPSFEKQLEFSQTIERFNKMTNMLKSQQNHSTSLFQSLLQKAFTGELVG